MVGARNPLQMPSRIPVFPLSGAVLMPFGHLPLNIFEPRYVNLIDDVLGEQRLLGMIQPRNAQKDPVPDDAELYDIGTLGRIIQFSDPGDGRYMVTLQGVSRFQVAYTETPQADRGYRWIGADFSAFEADLSPIERDEGPGQQRILELMRAYFGDNEIEADWDAVSEAPYEALIASLAMSCPFAPEEKQALVECPTFEDRARMLISLFEMSIANANADQAVIKH